MASFSRMLLVFLLISIMLICLLQDHPAMGVRCRRHNSYYPRINCRKNCLRRCSKAFWNDKCYDGCMACCHRCKCVPPGTYGGKQCCPCYANLKNSKNGKPKCP